jgi:predicted adenine nucleotide alpha hydrolase (AANH) superfamily ATPase
MSDSKIKLFEDRQVRALWDEHAAKWWFSVVDIVAVLTDGDYQTARNYWKVVKGRLAAEGNETVTNCYQLKMQAPDGKMRLTDAAATDISIVRQPSGFNESAAIAQEGAGAAKAARERIEQSTGKPVISRLSAKNLGQTRLLDESEGKGE